MILDLFREGLCRPGKGIASSFAYLWSDSLSILTIVHEMHTLPREIQLHSYLKSYNIILEVDVLLIFRHEFAELGEVERAIQLP